MLKKQTVWLLTMLSLMIVLSVYYMTSDTQENIAYIDDGEIDSAETTTDPLEGDEAEGTAEVNDIENLGQDELFTTIRMELQNERSMKKDRYKDVIASNSTTTDEKNEALNSMDTMDQISSKEVILQDSILAATEEYEDVLVRSEEEIVHVHVKVDELTKEEVVNIMQLVKDEFGEVAVDVNFQPATS